MGSVKFSKGMPKRIQAALANRGTEMTCEEIQDLAGTLGDAQFVFQGKNAKGWVAAIGSHEVGFRKAKVEAIVRERELLSRIAQLESELESRESRLSAVGQYIMGRFATWKAKAGRGLSRLCQLGSPFFRFEERPVRLALASKVAAANISTGIRWASTAMLRGVASFRKR